jgi:hypothetical protein
VAVGLTRERRRVERLVLRRAHELPVRVGRHECDLARIGLQEPVEVRGRQVLNRALEVGELLSLRNGLDAADRDVLEAAVGGGVPLDETIVVAERDVGRNVEARGLERLLGPVHQTGVTRPVPEGSPRMIGVVEIGVRAFGIVVVVLDAGVARGLRGSGVPGGQLE